MRCSPMPLAGPPPGVDAKPWPRFSNSTSPDAVVIPGPDGIDRPLPAAKIDEFVRQPVSIMPGDLVTLLSVNDLVDLMSWLETLKKTN